MQNETPLIKVFIENAGKYSEGKTTGTSHTFPTTPEALARTLEKIGIDGKNYEEWFIADYSTDIDGIKIGQFDSLDSINYLANKLVENESIDIKGLESILDYYDNDSVEGIINLLEDDNIDCFHVYDDIHDEEEYGRYLIEETGKFDTSVMGELAEYIDYESYGRDMSLNESSRFTNGGYVLKVGNVTNVFDGINVPEEYQVTRQALSINKEKEQERRESPAVSSTKNSIIGRIEADRNAKKSTPEKNEPTPKKSKINENEIE